MTIEDPSSLRIANDDNRMEIVKLQDQVNELKCRLAAREGMLAICSQQATRANDENTEITRLSSHIDELEQQLAEKDMQWASARELLQHKEVKILNTYTFKYLRKPCLIICPPCVTICALVLPKITKCWL